MHAYLDHAASTPMLPEVLEAMLPFLSGHHANSTGSHRAARDARRAVEDSRDDLADVVGVLAEEIVFTSGGTESNNIAIFGSAGASPSPGAVISAIEHPAILEPAEAVGVEVVGVDDRGLLDLVCLEHVLTARSEAPAIVSVMTANNEVGSIQPVVRIAELVRTHAPGALVHTDAVQALPWLDLRPIGESVDAMSLSAHKFGGPKGVGAMTWRKGIGLQSRQRGGGQERERRSGTHNVAGIVGLAAAARITDDRRVSSVKRVGDLRDRLVDGLISTVPGMIETGVRDGDRSHKVAGNAHVCISDVEAEALLFLLDEAGVAASAGASCASGAQEMSGVLTAMGVPEELGGGSVRLSLGWSSTVDDVDLVLRELPPIVTRLRETGS